MCMRRNGTACETAHFMVPPVGVTENPSAAFQNVQVALFLGRVASECTLPVIWTPSGGPQNPVDVPNSKCLFVSPWAQIQGLGGRNEIKRFNPPQKKNKFGPARNALL